MNNIMEDSITCQGEDYLQWLRKKLKRDTDGLEHLPRINTKKEEQAVLSTRKLVQGSFNGFYPRVIISYATGYRGGAFRDKPGILVAAGVANGLFQRGIVCFTDLMTPGGIKWDQYMLRIDSNKSNAKVLVALLSKSFFRSVWCLKEVYYAIKHNCVILPVRVEELVNNNGLDIAWDSTGMWPKDVINDWARKEGWFEMGQVGENHLQELKLERNVAAEKLQVQWIPHSGTLLADPISVLDQVESRVKQLLSDKPIKADCNANVEVETGVETPVLTPDEQISHGVFSTTYTYCCGTKTKSRRCIMALALLLTVIGIVVGLLTSTNLPRPTQEPSRLPTEDPTVSPAPLQTPIPTLSPTKRELERGSSTIAVTHLSVWTLPCPIFNDLNRLCPTSSWGPPFNETLEGGTHWYRTDDVTIECTQESGKENKLKVAWKDCLVCLTDAQLREWDIRPTTVEVRAHAASPACRYCSGLTEGHVTIGYEEIPPESVEDCKPSTCPEEYILYVCP